MAFITIVNLDQRKIKAIDLSKPVLKQLQESGLDWMYACGAKGRCTTCKFAVVDGGEHITPLTEAEQRYRYQGSLRENERLACQARIIGDIVIRVPDETKLSHMTYSDDASSD